MTAIFGGARTRVIPSFECLSLVPRIKRVKLTPTAQYPRLGRALVGPTRAAETRRLGAGLDSKGVQYRAVTNRGSVPAQFC